ncbi:TPA: helix-turn-helix transcriptional regulator [Legionella pneumophila]|nr:helix-turn-helix transcriptional regulator [Legionella pneumophila]HAT9273153.1 helix-turn-helix domain-containing protein [Legionella pneumophila subsp. pneumophila]MCZ4723731.1 helix-turn-helix transcriptional regulator [Legionella pneumophila]MCZ4728659.1 helix-turn-helix transcriptional regulator [Legionella pneumophila]MCZ4734000.1 helix-turn-helix transcriptional regulator [Legionella pneumophila]MDW8897921.1 helix-turn-helix transcriptional regulator [Legionella pneumophila]
MKKDPWLLKLGNKIREVRKEHGFSQEAIASEAGIDRSYMGGIERGERNIAAVNLIKIARALNVEVGELFPSIEVFKDL